MKSHVWDYAIGHTPRRTAERSARRRSVTQILRAAYQKYVRDRDTKRAIKRCLR